MEYEIQDQGEDMLFDDSTNPSLKRDEEEEPRRRRPEPADKRKLQKGELIPEEEEHQLA
jgi:hypothetical protein